MSNFMQINKELFRVILEEQVGNLWVLQHPFTHGGRRGKHEASGWLSPFVSLIDYNFDSYKPFSPCRKMRFATQFFLTCCFDEDTNTNRYLKVLIWVNKMAWQPATEADDLSFHQQKPQRQEIPTPASPLTPTSTLWHA